MADIAERQKLQADAGLTHLPTELTYELRMAVTGHRADEFLSWGYQWTDKPHRLVYEACGVVEAQAVEIESLYAEVERLREFVLFVDKWTNYKPNKPHQPTSYENCVKTIAPMAAEFAEEARAALAPSQEPRT